MNSIQSLSLNPDGSAVVTEQSRLHRFPTLEALAGWLHAESKPKRIPTPIVTARHCRMPAASRSKRRKVAA